MSNVKKLTICDFLPDYVKNNALAFHLVGIVPINCYHSTFKMPWHDCLMPISDDLLLIERSIMECALMGCNTIWVTCNKKIGKFLKIRMGEWVLSPSNKIIPIHYISIDTVDSQKKSLLYEILYSMLVSFWAYRRLSLWTIPTQYYLSFPNSVYPVENLKSCWKAARKFKRHFALDFNGKTFYNSFELLGCTVKFEDFLAFWQKWRDVIQERKNNDDKKIVRMEEIFDFSRYESEQKMIIELPFYHKFDNWQEYMNYFSDLEKREMIKREKSIFVMDGKRFFKGFEN